MSATLTLTPPAKPCSAPPRPAQPSPDLALPDRLPVQVFRVEGHARPCLGVIFAPFDPSLLVYNEETKHVFVRDWSSGEGGSDRSAAEGAWCGRSGCCFQWV